MVKKILIGLVIVIAIGGMIAFNLYKDTTESGSSSKKSTFSGKSIDVVAERIMTGEISSSVQLLGSVEEVQEKNVISDTPLEITKVLVEPGDTVKKGAVLFEADLSTLENELAQTKINYDIQNLQLEKLQTMSSSTDSAQIGIELAKLSLASAQRAYDTQVSNLEKNKSLLDEGIISQSEYDGMASGIEEAKSAVDSASLSLSRSRTDVSTSKESTSIDIQVQLKNLEALDMSIASLEERLADTRSLMLAPMSGVVTMSNLVEGEHSVSMTPMMTITDVEQLQVVANVREYDIKNIAMGQSVYLTGDAIPKGSEVIGEISYIAPIAAVTYVNNRETTAVKIEIKVTQGVDVLKPGYQTDCEVMTEVKEDVVMADYSMLKDHSEGGKYVFLVHEDGRIEKRDIVLGITSDFDAEVVEGLEEGDVVIATPSLAVKEDMKANITNDLDGDSAAEGE